MAPPRTYGPPGCPDGSPPGATVPCQSAVARQGSTPGGAGPTSSDLECRTAPREGWSCGALAPHHPTPPPPLRAAPPAQTVSPLPTSPPPHAAGEAGGPPPHRGQPGTGPGPLGWEP